MKTERYHSNDVKKLILKNKMSSMVEMKEVIGTQVDATIFRKLRELHYLRSYSHRGKYYTIPEVAEFDTKGLWSCHDVHFSKQGSLLNAIEYHVDRSVSGYFEYEIESLLHVVVRAAVLKLVKENKISRQKIAGRYLYCSSRMRKRNRQYADRKRDQIIKDSAIESMSSEMMFQEGKTLVELFLNLLDEKQRRLFAGLESIKLGYGGDKKIAHLFGLNMHTVAKGRRELCRCEIKTDRVRRVGGGRKFLEKKRRKS